MSGLSLILAVHTLSTVAMCGVIWFVQLVHYPLFQKVGQAEFAAYELDHQRRTTWLVAPLMSAEALSALSLVFLIRDRPGAVWALGGLFLLGVVWASTAFLQVPCHRKLAVAFDAPAAARLLRTNWLRTVAWTCRSILAILLSQVPLP